MYALCAGSEKLCRHHLWGLLLHQPPSLQIGHDPSCSLICALANAASVSPTQITHTQHHALTKIISSNAIPQPNNYRSKGVQLNDL